MANAQPEPSMEEILASIRRIISEDGEEEAAPATPQPTLRPRPAAVAPAPASTPPAPAARPQAFTEDATPSGAASAEDDRAQTHLRTEDIEMIKKNVASATRESEDVIVDETTASVASKAFSGLSQSVRISRGEGRTLEDIVTDMLRPLVKDWLDANLAGIVEEKVEAEVQRVARRRG